MARAPTFFAPEVVQTSSMDCGPATLKCLLEGFGTQVSYGRLREACQTDVDGTSIDVIEDVAMQLGLDAEQMVLPIDHLLLPESSALPAVVVMRHPDGTPHFIVVWRTFAGRVQIMDPGQGRRWITPRELQDDLFLHSTPIAAETFRQWAASDEFLPGLRRRLAGIGARVEGEALIDRCLDDPSWQGLAALDASLRMVDRLVKARGIDAGKGAGALLASLFESARADVAIEESEADVAARRGVPAAARTVPIAHWTATHAPPAEDGTPQVLVRGCVLVKVVGLRPVADREVAPEPLSPELQAALREKPTRPMREIVGMLRQDGVLTPAFVLGALLVASLAGAVEALLLRGLLDVGHRLGAVEQRAAGVVVLLALLIATLALEVPTAGALLRMGRRLETRLRVAFLAKIPKLSDRYFHSRPTSDMAHRCHAIHPLRQLPSLGGRLVRNVMDLVVTVSGLLWLDPRSWPVVILAAAASIAVPWMSQSAVAERDLRVRSFDGSLTRFTLDALLGLFAIRTHGAERALRTEHAAMLVDWMRAARDRLRASVAVDAVESVVGLVLAVWLTFDYLRRSLEPAAVLLLLYWALNVPQLGQEIASGARLYPSIRNLMLRLVEPLGALEEADDGPPHDRGAEPLAVRSPSTRGVHLAFRNVAVRAAGRTILEGLDLAISAGSRVAIVGPSGAGKSSLVGLLLGWHRPAEGAVEVDGAPLRGDALDRLRAETAWVDPAVQLWNRSLLTNLEYGSTGGQAIGHVLEEADLVGLLERLPDGLQTDLGEGGALVSGGEGQRVRLGRAMMRTGSRLVILDEPFRGLDRERRRALLDRALRLWSGTTLLCVTHDVAETRAFDRVLVVDGGRVCEDGPPALLAARAGGRYRAMLDAEEDVRRNLWSGDAFRRLHLRAGRVDEHTRGASDGVAP